MPDAKIVRISLTNTLVLNADLWDREKMADVIVGLKVLPKTVEVNLDELEEKIKKAINPQRISREPIAFGLVALLVTTIIPDAGGEMENIEKKLRDIEEVGEVEVTGVSRSL